MAEQSYASPYRFRRSAGVPSIIALLLFVASTAHALLLDTTNLTGANYVPFANLTLMGAPPGTTGRVDLQPVFPALVNAFSADAQGAFNADRAGQFPGWTFNVLAANQLLGTIRIDQYLARDLPGEIFGRGGARMDATYVPNGADPTTNLAWLNYFEDNVGGLRMHIDPFPNDDLGGGGGLEGMPFYYNTNEGITNLRFVDNPSDRVTSIPFDRYVLFETYLVGFNPAQINDGTAGGTIDVYGGFTWGYQVQVPEPGSLGLLAIGLGGIVPILRYRR